MTSNIKIELTVNEFNVTITKSKSEYDNLIDYQLIGEMLSFYVSLGFSHEPFIFSSDKFNITYHPNRASGKQIELLDNNTFETTYLTVLDWQSS